MKNYLIILASFMMAFFAAGCEKGNDTDRTPDVDAAKLVGCWYMYKVYDAHWDEWIEDALMQDYSEYTEDGTWKMLTVIFDEDGNFIGRDEKSVEYSVEGNIITSEGYAYTIKSLSDTELVIENPIGNVSYHRRVEALPEVPGKSAAPVGSSSGR